MKARSGRREAIMDEADKELLRDGRTVVVFGSMNMDLSVACDRMPLAGETIHGSDFVTGAGGKGANQAVAAARMGAKVHMIAAVGADTFGDQLVAGLEHDGIGTGQVRRLADVPTGVAVIVRTGGDNRIVLAAGANTALDGREVIGSIDALFDQGDARIGSIFLAQGECDLKATAQAIEHAHRRGMFTIFNPAPACNLPPQTWREVDLVCLNETECESVVGIVPTDEDDCRRALEALCRLTEGAALVTLGAGGSALLFEDEYVHLPARTVDVVDTTAAGDTYLGALAAMRSQGFPLLDSAGEATCASALAVSRLGAQASIPTAEEVMAWLIEQWENDR